MGESAVWPANPVLIPPTTDQIICRVLCPRLRDELLLLSPYSIICTGGTQDVCTAIMDDTVHNRNIPPLQQPKTAVLPYFPEHPLFSLVLTL